MSMKQQRLRYSDLSRLRNNDVKVAQNPLSNIIITLVDLRANIKRSPLPLRCGCVRVLLTMASISHRE